MCVWGGGGGGGAYVCIIHPDVCARRCVYVCDFERLLFFCLECCYVKRVAARMRECVVSML